MAELPDFLTSQHEAYERNKPTWEMNERRLRGGRDVTKTDLHKWGFEDEGSLDLRNRQGRACYLNFPGEFMTQIRGHLDREFPEPGHGLNYGSLGLIRPKRTGSPTRAEILHDNADGVGIDGASLRDFVLDSIENGGATGHRWIVATLPPMTEEQRNRLRNGGSLTVADEKAGLRPYLADYSPTAAPDWYYEKGVLQWIRFEFKDRSPRIGKDGKITSAERNIIVLYVRRGYALFGEVFGQAEGETRLYAEGGWWKYDEDGKLMDWNTLEQTGGEIPINPLIVKRDKRDLSRPLTTELGQVAAATMNLDSAADHDALVAGSRRLIITHCSGPSQTVFVEQVEDGSLALSIPEAPDQKFPIEVIDAAGTTANESLEARIDKKLKMAERIALSEVTSGPQASGESRKVEHIAKKSPLLAQVASSVETTMNTSIRFLQMLWGLEPDFTVKWERKFDLVPLVQDIRDSFGLQKEAAMKSKTLNAILIIQDAKEKGLISEDGELNEEAIMKELLESAELSTQGAGLLGSLGL